MSKFTIFAPLANSYLNGDQAPEKIEFTQADVLQSSIEGLANIASIEYDTFQEKSVSEHISDYEKMTKNRLHYGDQFKHFDDMANMFAKKLHDGITNLKKIKRDVTWLSEDVMRRYKQYVAEDPVVSAYTGEQDLSKLTMPAVNWDLLRGVSERVVISKVHEKIGQEDDAQINSSVVYMALNTLPGVSDGRTCEPVDLKPEKVEKIIDNVYSSVKGKCTRLDVQNVVRSTIFLTSDDLRRAANGLTALAEHRNVENINNVMTTIHCNELILPHITDEVTDVSAAARKKINYNIDLIREITDMASYVVINFRNNVWRDSILLPGPMINSDNADQFFAKGGTVSALVQYYNYAYKDTGVPAVGVGLDFTINSLGKAVSEYKAEAARQAHICEGKKKEFLRSAFINASVEFLQKHQDQLSHTFQASNIVQYVVSVYDSVLTEAPLENRLYDLILDSCYINSMERNLYHRLSQAYLKHAGSTEALTDEMCDHIDVGVYASMISEYLVEKGILITK